MLPKGNVVSLKDWEEAIFVAEGVRFQPLLRSRIKALVERARSGSSGVWVGSLRSRVASRATSS